MVSLKSPVETPLILYFLIFTYKILFPFSKARANKFMTPWRKMSAIGLLLNSFIFQFKFVIVFYGMFILSFFGLLILGTQSTDRSTAYLPKHSFFIASFKLDFLKIRRNFLTLPSSSVLIDTLLQEVFVCIFLKKLTSKLRDGFRTHHHPFIMPPE